PRLVCHALISRRSPRPTLFPYTTLFRSRQRIDQRWGTQQPVTIRDKDFGAVRLRAFGNYAYRIADAKLFHTELSGTRERYTVQRSEEHTSELQSLTNLVCRLLLEKKNKT